MKASSRENRFPKSEKYLLGAVYKDLLKFAASALVLQGRLSMWMPEVLSEEFQVGDQDVSKCLC